MLPEAVLEQVFEFLLTGEIVALWDTGDRGMLSKMANGAVKSLKVVELRHLRNYAPHFRLRKLDLSDLDFLDFNAAQSALTTVHRGLKELDMSSSKSSSLVIGNPRADEGSKESSSESHLLQLDLNLLFDCLEVLHIHVGYRRTLDPSTLLLLPQTLTSFTLSLNKRVGIIGRRTFPTLITAEVLRLLPPSLTQLSSMSFAADALCLLADDRTILPNLIDLTTPAIDMRKDNPTFATDGKWPPYFPVLDLYNVNSTDRLENLPTHLTSLNISSLSSGAPFTATISWIKSITPHLTQLTVPAIAWDEIKRFEEWPRSLTELNYSSCPPHMPKYHVLPRTLRTLDASYVSDEGITIAPKDLDVAMAFGRALLDNAEKQSWIKCKEYLKSLNAELYPRFSRHVDEYIAAVERGELHGLPLLLSNLTLEGSFAYNAWTKIYPPQLAHLELNFTWAVANSHFWNLLPPHLITLIVETDDFQMRSDYDWSPPWEVMTLFTDKPDDSPLFQMTSLSTLHIPIATASAFQFFPRSLTELKNTNIGTLSPTHDELAQLPQNLLTLEMAIIGSTPERWVEYLPRSLTELDLLHSTIEGSDFARLPPKLTLLTAVTRSLSLADLYHSPNTLELLDLEFDDDGPSSVGFSELAHLVSLFKPFTKFYKSCLEDTAKIIGVKHVS